MKLLHTLQSPESIAKDKLALSLALDLKRSIAVTPEIIAAKTASDTILKELIAKSLEGEEPIEGALHR